jgi:four helix bundle protein
MQYKKFEDIAVWQESRKLVNEVYRLIENNQKLKKDFSLVDQLKRATCSIMLNIAEGFERGSNKEFANFLNIAKGSAGEVRSLFYILHDLNFINREQFDNFHIKLINISTQLSNFRKYLIINHIKK